MLKEKNPRHKPIVGEVPLISHITSVRKGNFVIEAHTGAGKTTLGLMLYHKARLNEIPEYDVIYTNLREAMEALRDRSGSFEEKMLRAVFNHSSDEYKMAERHIYSSTKLSIKCSTFYNCIEGIEEYYTREQHKRLILVLDELERTLNWGVLEKVLTDWFTATRKFYESKGFIPIKLVVLLPKILKIRDFEESLRTSNEAVAVFTEFRVLSITDETLRSYIINLASNVNQRFSQLLRLENFKLLIKILSKLQSGRYIFPKLWEAISVSICNAVKGTIEGDELEFLTKFNFNLPDIDVDALLNPVIIGVSEGKPFRTSGSRSEVINMWENGFSRLCSVVGNYLPGIKGRESVGLRPLRIGYTDFVCKPNEAYIWMSLGKTLTLDTIKTLGNKILESSGTISASTLNIVALIPEFTKGMPIREIKLERELGEKTEERRSKSSKKQVITFKIKYRTIGTEELLSIATIGGLLGFDEIIARNIIHELAQDIASMITGIW
jgi:hypothetical protein